MVFVKRFSFVMERRFLFLVINFLPALAAQRKQKCVISRFYLVELCRENTKSRKTLSNPLKFRKNVFQQNTSVAILEKDSYNNTKRQLFY